MLQCLKHWHCLNANRETLVEEEEEKFQARVSHALHQFVIQFHVIVSEEKTFSEKIATDSSVVC